jgi:hypothetical protein
MSRTFSLLPARASANIRNAFRALNARPIHGSGYKTVNSTRRMNAESTPRRMPLPQESEDQSPASSPHPPTEHTRLPLFTWRRQLGAWIILLTILSYWQFPGHAYFSSDTLIYIPMMEHLWDPTLLKNDLLATHHYLAFTLYDEIALFLRRLTTLDFHAVLILQQWIFRSLAILGVYLLARGLELSNRMAVLVTGIFSLGSTIVGPSLSSLELEPVPRAFAFPLILLSLGLIAHGRYLAASVAGSVSFLFQAPTGYPFWMVFVAFVLWPDGREARRRRLLAFLPPLLAGISLLILSGRQASLSPPDPFFGRVDSLQAHIQRTFLSYSWISIWPRSWVRSYIFLGVVTGLAVQRLWKWTRYELRFFLIGLPLIAILSMPASYLLLEKLRWNLMAQFEPMRALLYLSVFAELMSVAAGIKAAEQRHYGQAFLWLAVAFTIPTEPVVIHVLIPNLRTLAAPDVRRHIFTVVVLAATTLLAIWAETMRRRWAGVLLTAVIIFPFLLLPLYGKVRAFIPPDNPQLQDLSNWARSSASKDAVFLFPDAWLSRDPSIFRATALRAVYVDGESMALVNYLRDYTTEWWSRWKKQMSLRVDPQTLEFCATLGVDYVVLYPNHRIPKAVPVFENSRFVVYQVLRSR